MVEEGEIRAVKQHLMRVGVAVPHGAKKAVALLRHAPLRRLRLVELADDSEPLLLRRIAGRRTHRRLPPGRHILCVRSSAERLPHAGGVTSTAGPPDHPRGQAAVGAPALFNPCHAGPPN
jgi:hypothetical protein